MKKAVVDSSKLFAKRNHLIEKRPSEYYPSIGAGGSCGVKEFIEKWGKISAPSTVTERLHGRVQGVRSAGKNMCFLDLGGLQVVMNSREMKSGEGAINLAGKYRAGDYVLVSGRAALTEKRRTLSIRAEEPPKVVAAAQQPLPPLLEDYTKLKQNRVLSYQLKGVEMLVARHKVTKALREFLDQRNFVEVETPILSSKANGANAEAFSTYCHALPENERRLELRVAPELWLKRLVIGGLERVYELGKVFRNEGVDSTHNPEFTSLEFYQAFASMDDLIENVRRMLIYVCSAVSDLPMARRLLLEIERGGLVEVDFVDTICSETGSDFHAIEDWSNPELLWEAIPPADRKKLFADRTPNQLSAAQIWNRMGGYYVEERHCNGLRPTLICNHPSIISPLAKPFGERSRLSRRFELFILGKEYANAYEEENCPQRQLQSFREQAQTLVDYGDKESLCVDEPYVDAMKWGMPPTGGVGLGIDRLILLLLDGKRIEEVLSFGCVDDVNRQ